VDEQREPDLAFAESVPELYDQLLVPLIFEVYADDLVARLEGLGVSSVLEVAAGSGAVTRAMASGLPRPVTWQSADVMALPLEDESFDAVVRQFGMMFFPGRPRSWR